VQNDTLTALLLDPFITFDEAMKQALATPAVTPKGVTRPSAGLARRVCRHPARVSVRTEAVVHHPPVAAGGRLGL
jgi:hypothetical protein